MATEDMVSRLEEKYEGLKEAIDRYRLMFVEEVGEYDDVYYLVGLKMTFSRSRKVKQYVFILSAFKTKEGKLRIARVRGFPVDLLDKINEYVSKIRERLKNLGIV